jgi:hypothetical protein
MLWWALPYDSPLILHLYDRKYHSRDKGSVRPARTDYRNLQVRLPGRPRVAGVISRRESPRPETDEHRRRRPLTGAHGVFATNELGESNEAS